MTTKPLKKTALPSPMEPESRSRKILLQRTGFWLVFVAVAFVGASFVILMGFTSIIPTNTVVIQVMVINGILVAFLLGFLIKELMYLYNARRKGKAAARLHIRIVGLFAIVATLPAVFVAIAAGFTLNLG